MCACYGFHNDSGSRVTLNVFYFFETGPFWAKKGCTKSTMQKDVFAWLEKLHNSKQSADWETNWNWAGTIVPHLTVGSLPPVKWIETVVSPLETELRALALPLPVRSRGKLIGQFKHQTLFATQTQTQHNPDFSANDWWGCSKFCSLDWCSRLGYVGFEFALQITFGA